MAPSWCPCPPRSMRLLWDQVRPASSEKKVTKLWRAGPRRSFITGTTTRPERVSRMSTRAPHQSRERSWASIQVSPWSRLRTDQTSLKTPGTGSLVWLFQPHFRFLVSMNTNTRAPPRVCCRTRHSRCIAGSRSSNTGPLADPVVSIVTGVVGFVAFDRHQTAVVQQHEGPVPVSPTAGTWGGSRLRRIPPARSSAKP